MIVCLIALALVPCGFNAVSVQTHRLVDPSVFRLFLGISVFSWAALVLFSVLLSVTRSALSNFSWKSVAGVFCGYLVLSLLMRLTG